MKKALSMYYTNFRTDVYSLQLDQIVGKTVLEIHPELTEEQSTIMQVLKTGQPIYDRVRASDYISWRHCYEHLQYFAHNAGRQDRRCD